MKIHAASRDEVLKRKAAYEQEYNERKSRYDAQKAQYDEADKNARQALADEVNHIVEGSGLDLRVDVTISFRDYRGYKVSISDELDKFNPDKALSWNWSVQLNSEGEIEKESSSWSGLQAVSATNIDNLKKIVSVLEKLNSVDWKELLSRHDAPKYQNYITEKNPEYDNQPNFDYELLIADVEDAIGRNILLKGGGQLNNHGIPVGEVYYQVLKETPTQYRIKAIPGYAIHQSPDTVSDVVDRYDGTERNMKKSSFIPLLHKPIQTLEF